MLLSIHICTRYDVETTARPEREMDSLRLRVSINERDDST